MRNDSAEVLFQSLLQAAFASSSLFDVVHPIGASPILQGALKEGLREAVVMCDMPEQCKLLSNNSCQKRFLWAHKEVDLALHPGVGLVLQGDACVYVCVCVCVCV